MGIKKYIGGKVNSSDKITLILLISFGNPVVAQSPVGECSIETNTDDMTTHDSMFVLDGIEFDEASLSMPLQQALFDERLKFYKAQLQIIDSAILEIALEKRATSEGRSLQDLTKELFEVTPPDDNTIATFYQQNKGRIPYPLEQVRDQIQQMLMQQQAQLIQQALLKSTKEKYDFALALAEPTAPYAEISSTNFPSKGPADAKVTLIEFADYQCPHCKKAAGVLQRLGEQFADDLRIVFMDFPVNPSGISKTIALGAACANQQDKFWAYHDLAFERQDQLSAESAEQLAGELGLNIESFQNCMSSNESIDHVARSISEAERLGLSGTPTFFLNGRRLHLHDFESDLVDEITNELRLIK